MSIKNPSRREKRKYKRLTKCPQCGSPNVKVLGGSWCNMRQYLNSSGGKTIRVEFCLDCPFVKKLYRIYPEHKESDWKEFV